MVKTNLKGIWILYDQNDNSSLYCNIQFSLYTLNYISFRSTQSLWEKYVWSEDRLLTLGRNQDVFWENNLFAGIGKFSFPLEPLPSIIAQLKTHLIQLRKQNLNKTKANKQTNKQNANKKVRMAKVEPWPMP